MNFCSCLLSKRADEWITRRPPLTLPLSLIHTGCCWSSPWICFPLRRCVGALILSCVGVCVCVPRFWLAVDLSIVISLFPFLSICFSSLRWFQYIKGVAFRFWQGRMGSSIVYSEGAFLVIFYANIEWLYPLFFLSTDVLRVWGPVYLFPEFIVDRSIMLSCYCCSHYCRKGWGFLSLPIA